MSDDSSPTPAWGNGFISKTLKGLGWLNLTFSSRRQTPSTSSSASLPTGPTPNPNSASSMALCFGDYILEDLWPTYKSSITTEASMWKPLPLKTLSKLEAMDAINAYNYRRANTTSVEVAMPTPDAFRELANELDIRPELLAGPIARFLLDLGHHEDAVEIEEFMR